MVVHIIRCHIKQRNTAGENNGKCQELEQNWQITSSVMINYYSHQTTLVKSKCDCMGHKNQPCSHVKIAYHNYTMFTLTIFTISAELNSESFKY